MLIDRHLPQPDATKERHLIVDAHPERTFDALGSAKVRDPILQLLFTLSRMPSRILTHAKGREPAELPREPELPVVSWREDVVVLDTMPGEELVSGAVLRIRPWQGGLVHRIPASDFRAFDQPEHLKLAIGFSIRAYGDERSLLSMEVRARGTDAKTARLAKWGLRLSAPIAGPLMARTLHAIKDEAEHPVRAPPTGPATTPPAPEPRREHEAVRR